MSYQYPFSGYGHPHTLPGSYNFVGPGGVAQINTGTSGSGADPASTHQSQVGICLNTSPPVESNVSNCLYV